MIVFSGWVDFMSLSRESLSYSFTLLDSSCSEIIVSNILAFISYLFLVSLHVQ